MEQRCSRHIRDIKICIVHVLVLDNTVISTVSTVAHPLVLVPIPVLIPVPVPVRTVPVPVPVGAGKDHPIHLTTVHVL